MNSFISLLVGAVATILGAWWFYLGYQYSMGASSIRGDVFGVAGLLAFLIGLYFVIMGAIRARSN